jgi:hypothetical protein
MNMLQIIIMLHMIESGGRMNPPDGDKGLAVGPLQIHPIMVEEVNRIVGRERFRLEDRRSFVASYSMCATFLRYQRKRWRSKYGYDCTTATLMGSWNSGSVFHDATLSYQQKIHKQLGARHAARSN